MAYRLPPLNALRLFEAAGRHLSFKLAAEELNLTPSAVSHGIQGLEDWLGVPLFARSHRQLSLTRAGLAYLPRVREILAQIASATEAVPGRRPADRLSVSVAPTFGQRWLIPRLSRFQACHPGIDVSLDSAHRKIEFPRDGVDIAIRMGEGGWENVSADLLARQHLVPVCAPHLAAAVRAPADLAGHTLLHVTDVSEDWAAWAALRGIAAPDLERGLRFDSIHLAWEAAIQGLGVALGRLPVVAGDLEAGRLVAVLGPPVEARTAYWLLADHASLHRPEVAAFRTWLREELAAPQPGTQPQRPM
ncbi:transcriptional regulator GcvA [Roseixanthobacter glucoisosaccharinicivorans]|uniref:transcriptional regulator GcvA n=1 Tax=Roseixanthobacter glucoisosaccharinicivorans TaxID=3119923 RepID=UPI00372BAD81